MKPFNIIVAQCSNRGIGYNNKVPWRLPEDVNMFKETTTRTIDPSKQNVVIMGRNTWESIPKKYRPLTLRINIVISSTYISDAYVVGSFNEALDLADTFNAETIFVIGGQRVYEEAIKSPRCQGIYLTQIYREVKSDVFFPEIDENVFKLYSCTETKYTTSGVGYDFRLYVRE